MLRQRAMEDQARRGKRVMEGIPQEETPEAGQFAEWAGSKLDTKYRPGVYGAFGGSTTAGE
jgi:hypothetical protein